MKNKKALVILADGFEEIEGIAPIDILRRSGVEVLVAGLDKPEIKSARGIRITVDKKLNGDEDGFDAVILPGGAQGAENLAKSEIVAKLIARMNEKGRVVAAICASPAVVLAPAGILKGRKATCYPGEEKKFKIDTEFIDDKVVVDGNIITSKGPGTAILFGLKLTEALMGKDVADSVREKMIA